MKKRVHIKPGQGYRKIHQTYVLKFKNAQKIVPRQRYSIANKPEE